VTCKSQCCLKDLSRQVLTINSLLLALRSTNRFSDNIIGFDVLCHKTSFAFGCSHVAGWLPVLGFSAVSFTLGTITSVDMNGG
jgi:hypothetical protein